MKKLTVVLVLVLLGCAPALAHDEGAPVIRGGFWEIAGDCPTPLTWLVDTPIETELPISREEMIHTPPYTFRRLFLRQFGSSVYMAIVGKDGEVWDWIIGNLEGHYVRFERRHSHTKSVSEVVMLATLWGDNESIRYETFTRTRHLEATGKWLYLAPMLCDGALTWQP